MAVRVKLQDLLEAMGFQSDEMTSYLHRPTGRVVIVSDEAIHAAEAGGQDYYEPHELADAQGLLANEDDYLPLPDRFEIDEYRMMERFAAGLADPALRDGVLYALGGGRGVFRRFKDAVHSAGLADEWYAYRDRSYEEVARAWCEAHGIELEPPAADV